MGNAVSVLNEQRSELSKAGKALLDEYVEIFKQSDEFKSLNDDLKISLVQKKIGDLLVSHSLPPILMIKLETMIDLGTFPRCPNNVSITTDLKSIDRANSFLVFISHCWMRGYSGAEGWDGRPHPDNAAGDKFKLCVKGIEMLWKTFAPRMKNCYVWLDFGCINQDGNPAGELEQLDKIVASCDCIFTPIVDNSHAGWQYILTQKGFFADYKAPLWNDGTHAYLNRGWCRVEMLYAANIPVLKNANSEVERHTMFEAGLAHHCKENRRPHFLYGTKEYSGINVVPMLLPPLQHSYLTDYHPLKGNLSVLSDLVHIETLIAELQPYLDANAVDNGYVGERNDKGEMHGHGTYQLVNGDVHEGEYKNGKMHGRGTYRFASGAVFEGEYRENMKHGHAVYRYASGNVFEGEYKDNNINGYGTLRYASGASYKGQFSNNKKHGHGTFCYVDGALYDGEWADDKMCGNGTYRYANGALYEGEYRENKMHGHGTFRSSDGAVYVGDFRDGKKHGRGSYKYADGDVYDGDWNDDMKHGHGTFHCANGKDYVGLFENDEYLGVE